MTNANEVPVFAGLHSDDLIPNQAALASVGRFRCREHPSFIVDYKGRGCAACRREHEQRERERLEVQVLRAEKRRWRDGGR